jgi:hypothetical protein
MAVSMNAEDQEVLQQIERAKREWEATVDALPDLILLVNAAGSVLRANRSVETWHCCRVTEAAGMPVHALLHPGCMEPCCSLAVLLAQILGSAAFVLTCAEELSRSAQLMSPDELQEFFTMLQHSADKAVNIIDELLLLAGIRKMDIAAQPLEMVSIIQEAQRRLVGMIAASEAEIEAPDAWPVALGYAPWVEAIWANYLSNGIKYGGHPPRLRLGGQVGVESEGVPGRGSLFYFTLPEAGTMRANVRHAGMMSHRAPT